MKLFVAVAALSLTGEAALSGDPFSLTTLVEVMRQVPGLVVMGIIVRMFLRHMEESQTKHEAVIDRVLDFASKQDQRQRELCGFRRTPGGSDG